MGAGKMELTINGEQKRFDRIGSLSELLSTLGLNPGKLAVERNREIVPKSAYERTRLSDGDRLEIVHFVGGG